MNHHREFIVAELAGLRSGLAVAQEHQARAAAELAALQAAARVRDAPVVATSEERIEGPESPGEQTTTIGTSPNPNAMKSALMIASPDDDRSHLYVGGKVLALKKQLATEIVLCDNGASISCNTTTDGRLPGTGSMLGCRSFDHW